VSGGEATVNACGVGVAMLPGYRRAVRHEVAGSELG
jgi:hypothetical protein